MRLLRIQKIALLCLVVMALASALTGCIPGDGSSRPDSPAGFFTGIWHGWIAPFALVYSVFNKETGIYEIYNNGLAYNIGYYIAIISGFGGLALARKKR